MSETASNNNDVINLSALFNTVWRGKYWLVLWIFVFASAAAYYAFEIAVAKYRSSTTILLDTTQQSLLDLGVSLPSLGSESEAINTEVEILKSRRLMAEVARVANLVEDPEFNGTLREPTLIDQVKEKILGPKPEATDQQIQTIIVNNLLEATSIKNTPLTYTLSITVVSENPLKSAYLADEVANQYIIYKKNAKRRLTEDSSEWLSSRVVDLKVELEEAESKVSNFTTRARVISPEVISALNQQLKEQRDRLEASKRTLMAAETKSERLNTLTNASAQERVNAAENTRLRILFDTEGAGPGFDRQFNLIRRETELQVIRERNQLSSLEASVDDLVEEISAQNKELIELQQLTREAEASRLLYEYFLSRLKENSAQEGIQQGEAQILSNAVPPNSASSPNKKLLIAFASVLGAMLGMAQVLLSESKIRTYRDPSELQKNTGLSVLGQIPIIPARRRRTVLEYLSKNPASAAAEMIRNLRTSLVLSNVDKTPQVIMVTSSLPGEGKTTVSFALAQNYVGLGKKVLLIEGDIRRRVFGQYLNLDDPKGLMSVMAGESSLKDVVVFDDIIGADILVSEKSNINAADLLSSDRFKDMINQSREEYDFIIIDTPPVLVVPDSRVIGQVVDAVSLVVRWDSTTREQLHDAIDMFDTVGIKINGLVLNQISIKGMKRYGYGDKYGAYGQYGSKYYTK